MNNILDTLKKKIGGIKTFGPTNWAVNNKTATYLITILITLYGLYKFNTLPKEQFPDIVVPTISVQTVYFGNSPKDIENLVNRPIEKQIRGLSGAKIKKVTSTALQDFGFLQIEFDTDVKVDIAKQKVKDAVDKAKQELPNDLTTQPNVAEFNFSDLPIMYVNVSGDYEERKLKIYAEKLKDRIEELSEINKAELVGAPEREIQINVHQAKMDAARITFRDIENAVNYENRDISGGQIEVGNMNRTLKVKGQFTSAFALNELIIKNVAGAPVYLKDIADIEDKSKLKDSYARLNGKKVITINVTKRAGENLINASDKIRKIVQELKANEFPKDLTVTVTGDQAIPTKTSFDELINTIIIGFILVLIVLMFFMGITNAFFVALSVPLSVFVAFLFLPLADNIVGTSVTLNFIVLFALLFGLGIIVDDAIVVIENTHRIYHNGKVPIVKAAKEAAGEVFIPVLAGTLTTLAPFFPLLLWKGLIGKFMIYLPTMLILTLAASLIVAFIINPVFAVSFMKPEGREYDAPKRALFKKSWFWTLIGAGLLMHVAQYPAIANFLLAMAVLAIFSNYVLKDVIHVFQHKLLPRLMNAYEKLLRWALQGRRPIALLVSLFMLFPVALGLLVASKPDVVFFPQGDPNNFFVFLKLPVGTNVKYTDSITNLLEETVANSLKDELPGKPKAVVESIISNVALGAGNPRDANRSIQSNLGRIQVSFVPFEQRHGKATLPMMENVRKALKDIPGATISVEAEAGGPPTDPPVNIEFIGDDYDKIGKIATDFKNYLDSNTVDGMVGLSLDVDLNNPEITVTVDRAKAMAEGLSTAQIGMEIRTALFGKEVSKLKDGEDDYKIQLRYTEALRNDINTLMNMKITFRDFNTGAIKQIPISAVASFDYTNTNGGIIRKQYKRTVSLQANVASPELAQPVNAELTRVLEDFKSTNNISSDITIKQGGQGEQEAETSAFLGGALITSLLLILLILVLQFNSLSKPFIVLSEIFFSIIGVLLGFAVTGMTISTIMVGVGVIGLAGIVIKNGILLIEFTDELRSRGMRTREAAIQAGKIRIIPVLLTAVATMLGLLPLAVGMNINFLSLLRTGNPHIFFGGDSVVFWGPLSWTIIFGLIFAFFLTLLMVPSMYIIAERLKRPMEKFYGTKWIALFGFLGPFFFLFVFIMYVVRWLQGKRVWVGQPKKPNRKVKK
jgi:multidrug efflux pump subunit AcrB